MTGLYNCTLFKWNYESKYDDLKKCPHCGGVINDGKCYGGTMG